jgi:uncharacterized protein (TIGR02145 family)
MFSFAQSQTITNVIAKQDGNNVVITYNLLCEGDADISLSVSEDGGSTFKGPLKSITGDIGVGIKPGSKTIIWNTLKDQTLLVGENIVFRVSMPSKFGRFTDSRDGKTYKTIKIGTQTWMADNLAYKTNDGCWVYDNIESNVKIYGYLYNLETANKVCPSGWHLPAKEEYESLMQNIGGNGSTAFKSLLPNGESGFSALFSGCRALGTFYSIDKYAFFWSSTSNDETSWCFELISAKENNKMVGVGPKSGLSVRCVKD